MSSDEKSLALIKMLSAEVFTLQRDLLDILQTQENLIKMMAAKLPNFTQQEQIWFRGVAAKIETALEHDEAAFASFRAEFERLYNA
jgi:hypothetical protein